LSKILTFILVFLLGILQTQFKIGNVVPDLLLLFFVFLVFKKIYFQGISLLFILVLRVLSSASTISIILYWIIIEIIINMWRRSFISIHKSASFFLIISLSVYSFIFWRTGYALGFNYWLDLLKFLSFNLLFFIPFYFLLPEIYSNEEQK